MMEAPAMTRRKAALRAANPSPKITGSFTQVRREGDRMLWIPKGAGMKRVRNTVELPQDQQPKDGPIGTRVATETVVSEKLRVEWVPVSLKFFAGGAASRQRRDTAEIDELLTPTLDELKRLGEMRDAIRADLSDIEVEKEPVYDALDDHLLEVQTWRRDLAKETAEVARLEAVRDGQMSEVDALNASHTARRAAEAEAKAAAAAAAAEAAEAAAALAAATAAADAADGDLAAAKATIAEADARKKAKKRPTKEQKKAEAEARLSLAALTEKAEDGNTPLMRATAALRAAAAEDTAKAAVETAAALALTHASREADAEEVLLRAAEAGLDATRNAVTEHTAAREENRRGVQYHDVEIAKYGAQVEALDKRIGSVERAVSATGDKIGVVKEKHKRIDKVVKQIESDFSLCRLFVEGTPGRLLMLKAFRQPQPASTREKEALETLGAATDLGPKEPRRLEIDTVDVQDWFSWHTAKAADPRSAAPAPPAITHLFFADGANSTREWVANLGQALAKRRAKRPTPFKGYWKKYGKATAPGLFVTSTGHLGARPPEKAYLGDRR